MWLRTTREHARLGLAAQHRPVSAFSSVAFARSVMVQAVVSHPAATFATTAAHRSSAVSGQPAARVPTTGTFPRTKLTCTRQRNVPSSRGSEPATGRAVQPGHLDPRTGQERRVPHRAIKVLRRHRWRCTRRACSPSLVFFDVPRLGVRGSCGRRSRRWRFGPAPSTTGPLSIPPALAPPWNRIFTWSGFSSS